MIKAVIFDFGNVICRFDNKIVLTRVAELTSRGTGELEEIVYRSGDVVRQYEKGLVTSHEFFLYFETLLRLGVTEEEFIRLYTDKFMPIHETYDVIRRLKGRHRLGLLSNTSEWDFEYGIKKTEVFPLFDAVTLSFRVHALKPAAEIYADAVQKLGVQASECVYIDDIPQYVEAARGLGMTALWYRSPLDLSEGLRDILAS